MSEATPAIAFSFCLSLKNLHQLTMPKRTVSSRRWTMQAPWCRQRLFHCSWQREEENESRVKKLSQFSTTQYLSLTSGESQRIPLPSSDCDEAKNAMLPPGATVMHPRTIDASSSETCFLVPSKKPIQAFGDFFSCFLQCINSGRCHSTCGQWDPWASLSVVTHRYELCMTADWSPLPAPRGFYVLRRRRSAQAIWFASAWPHGSARRTRSHPRLRMRVVRGRCR